jgi:hypothetical protein
MDCSAKAGCRRGLEATNFRSKRDCIWNTVKALDEGKRDCTLYMYLEYMYSIGQRDGDTTVCFGCIVLASVSFFLFFIKLFFMWIKLNF